METGPTLGLGGVRCLEEGVGPGAPARAGGGSTSALSPAVPSPGGCQARRAALFRAALFMALDWSREIC